MTNKAYHVVRLRRNNTYRHRIIHAPTPQAALATYKTSEPMAAYWTTTYRLQQSEWKDLPQYVRNLMSVTMPAASINDWSTEAIPV